MARRRENDLHTTVAARLRQSGLRYTASRRAVVEALAAAQRPLTIPELLEADNTLAQSSAYRNLNELIIAGVVQRVLSGDEFAHFELAEDVTDHHHHHMVCGTCGRVEDFTVSDDLEATLAAAFSRVARRSGFAVEHHRLDLLGRCATCS